VPSTSWTASSPPSSSSRGETIALAVLVVASLWLAYRLTRPLLLVLAAAAAAASLLTGPCARLTRRLRGRRRTGAAATVALLLLGILGPVIGLGGWAAHRLLGEAIEAIATLPAARPMLERLAHHAGPLQPVVSSALGSLSPKLANWMPAVAQALSHSITVAGHAAVEIAIGLFLFALALYYFLLDGAAWAARLVTLVPLPDDDVRLFLTRFRQTAAGILIGNVGTAATQATVATIGYLIFGAPLPLFAGALTFLAALVPLVGPTLAWLPLAIYLGFTRGTVSGVGLGLYGLLVVSTVDNVVRPLLTGRVLPLHPLLLFVAVLGGITTGGAAGLFWGPFIMALAVTSVELWEARGRPPVVRRA
jgi:predicted PurR-regulated permease PerM